VIPTRGEQVPKEPAPLCVFTPASISPHVEHRLVEVVDPDQPVARHLKVVDHLERERHHAGEYDHVQPVEGALAAHVVAGEQDGEDADRQEEHEDGRRCVRVERCLVTGAGVQHPVE